LNQFLYYFQLGSVVFVEILTKVRITRRGIDGYILTTPDSTLHHQKKLHSDWCVFMVQSRAMPREPFFEKHQRITKCVREQLERQSSGPQMHLCSTFRCGLTNTAKDRDV
ncbi:unnamed protein product, partial [Bubo scandiacus]